MKKDEFIGYLTGLKDAVETTDEEWLLNKILERAKTLELNYSYPYYPTYPWIWYDTKPYVSPTIAINDTTVSSSDAADSFTYSLGGLDNQSKISYNIDWEVLGTADNWRVEYK